MVHFTSDLVLFVLRSESHLFSAMSHSSLIVTSANESISFSGFCVKKVNSELNRANAVYQQMVWKRELALSLFLFIFFILLPLCSHAGVFFFRSCVHMWLMLSQRAVWKRHTVINTFSCTPAPSSNKWKRSRTASLISSCLLSDQWSNTVMKINSAAAV